MLSEKVRKNVTNGPKSQLKRESTYPIAVTHEGTNQCWSSVEYRHLVLINNIPTTTRVWVVWRLHVHRIPKNERSGMRDFKVELLLYFDNKS